MTFRNSKQEAFKALHWESVDDRFETLKTAFCERNKFSRKL